MTSARRRTIRLAGSSCGQPHAVSRQQRGGVVQPRRASPSRHFEVATKLQRDTPGPVAGPTSASPA